MNIELSEIELEFLTSYCESQNITIELYIKDYLTKQYKQYLGDIEFRELILSIINENEKIRQEEKKKYKIVNNSLPADKWG